MEQFCGTAVADEEIRLIAPCGSMVDLKGDFLNPRGMRYLILVLRRTVSLRLGCVLRYVVHHSLTCCAFELVSSSDGVFAYYCPCRSTNCVKK
jgi:hypothetical protein